MLTKIKHMEPENKFHRLSAVKFIMILLINPGIFVDLRIMCKLSLSEVKYIMTIIFTVQYKKNLVFSRKDIEPFMLLDKEKLNRTVLKNLDNLVNKGYLSFVNNELGGNRTKVLKKYTISKPKIDYFVGCLNALIDRKYNCFQHVTAYRIEENMTKLTRLYVVKHKRNMSILKKMK